ncbi:PQQ-dependent sugar dehydrogenase [Chitinophaga pinensis]|uniref:Glucose sorbosone dehydrogenase n=1 Tax=Chitinophaga pinensis (strain ATCC 43595 / DSM 2588 / LMG 13176 / NBRC 15968 / NCIMB 11800 / UQM 2034) TaxID=485918 RepID=A0A979G8L9_CHIPD|nr:PQQ-dependent sugar dehydrogenase [Chitinophaga pinensis]ACU62770.1 glucose sorbosone dehydrogenase [Chitinophaga pinensis DSM 2588]
MKKSLQALITGTTFVLASCGSPSGGQHNTTDSTATDSTIGPVETKKPNSDYKPAFPGQTRINGIKTKTPYEGTVLSDKLENPWGITTLPDGRLLITEKKGVLRIATTSGQLSEPITGLPKVNPDGQGGLLGIRVDPDFKTNRMVYWVFSEPRPDGNLTAVAKGKLSADEKTIEDATVIYRATPAFKGTLHYGGRIVFDKDGNLVISTGERSDLQTRPQAQQLNSALGKVLRITKEGKPAAGNPFAGQADARPEIYSYGHRNVQGLAFNPATGDLWETEFGPRGGDELNRIEAGKNYGWPTITYGIEYKGDKVGDGIQQKDGLEQPVYYWDPVLSPSGITFYSGKGIPEWKGNLFICGLSSIHIARLVIENNKVVGEEMLLLSEEQRFRDITEGDDGALYAVTDNGRLYSIHKK